MKKTRLAAILIIVLCVAAAAAVLIYRVVSKPSDGIQEQMAPASVPEGKEKITIDLYFADSEGSRLALERSEIPVGFIDILTRNAIEALIAGPEKETLSRTIPEGVEIRSVFVKNGTAYVDFTSAMSAKHVGGVWTELLTIYSVVNTLTENFSEIGEVQILIDGRESETLAGHVDISRPLKGRIQLLAGDW